MNKSKFFGKAANSVALYKEKRLPTVQQEEERSFVNLKKLDIHILTKELIEKYNQNNDTGIIQSFFRKKKFEGQEKMLDALLSITSSIRQHSNSLIEYKALLATQQDIFEIIAEGKIIEAELMAASRKAMLEIEVFRYQVEKEKAIAELDSLIIENSRARNEAEKIKYEAEEIKQRAKIVQLRGKLIEKITAELDFAHIDMKQVFVLIEMVKDIGAPQDIIAAEAKWEQLKAEAKKMMAQAEQEETKADWEKFKFNQDSKAPDV